MNLADLKKVNILWREIYPYLAAQIMESYKKHSGTVLELGPFSGGISFELARRYPALEVTIADVSPEVVAYLREETANQGLASEIAVKRTDLYKLAFSDSHFDLVIFRGLFFFLDEEGTVFREVFRVLNDGGMAILGGGYGKGAPGEVINKIADESRELNERLGRKRVSIEELERMIMQSGLTANCETVEEGGLWLIIRK